MLVLVTDAYCSNVSFFRCLYGYSKSLHDRSMLGQGLQQVKVRLGQGESATGTGFRLYIEVSECRGVTDITCSTIRRTRQACILMQLAQCDITVNDEFVSSLLPATLALNSVLYLNATCINCVCQPQQIQVYLLDYLIIFTN